MVVKRNTHYTKSYLLNNLYQSTLIKLYIVMLITHWFCVHTVYMFTKYYFKCTFKFRQSSSCIYIIIVVVKQNTFTIVTVIFV